MPDAYRQTLIRQILNMPIQKLLVCCRKKQLGDKSALIEEKLALLRKFKMKQAMDCICILLLKLWGYLDLNL